LSSAIRAKLQIKHREEDLLRRNRELEAINAVSAAAIGTLDPQRVLKESFAALMERTDLAAGAIYMYDETADQLMLTAEQGIARPQTQPAHEGLPGQILRTQQAIVRNELEGDPDLQIETSDGRGEGALASIEGHNEFNEELAAFIGVPLRGVERSLGLLEIYHRRPYAFETRDQELYTAIGNRIGIVLENAQIFQRAQALLLKSSALNTGAGETPAIRQEQQATDSPPVSNSDSPESSRVCS
jgi:GAF domain-containing protein